MHVQVVLVGALLLAGLVAAEGLAGSHAPQPSPGHTTLWAHRDPVDHRFDHHMSSDLNETDPANPGTDAPGGSWHWTLTLKPALNHTLLLDGNGTIHFAVHLGGNTHLGDVQVATTLHHGQTLIGQGETQEHTFTPSGDEEAYPLLEWDTDVEHDRLGPGQQLVWTVTAQGTFTGIAMGMSQARGNSQIELPIIAALAPTPEATEDELVTPGPGALLFVGLVGLSIALARITHQRKTQ